MENERKKDIRMASRFLLEMGKTGDEMVSIHREGQKSNFGHGIFEWPITH